MLQACKIYHLFYNIYNFSYDSNSLVANIGGSWWKSTLKVLKYPVTSKSPAFEILLK